MAGPAGVTPDGADEPAGAGTLPGALTGAPSLPGAEVPADVLASGVVVVDDEAAGAVADCGTIAGAWASGREDDPEGPPNSSSTPATVPPAITSKLSPTATPVRNRMSSSQVLNALLQPATTRTIQIFRSKIVLIGAIRARRAQFDTAHGNDHASADSAQRSAPPAPR